MNKAIRGWNTSKRVLCVFFGADMRVIYSKVVNSTWLRERVEIFTHALCCFRTQNPRFREYARPLSNWAIDRRNWWPPGWNYWDFMKHSFLFFLKKLRRSRANVSHDIKKKLGLFIFKVGGELAWNSRRVSPAAGPYWKPCSQFLI